MTKKNYRFAISTLPNGNGREEYDTEKRSRYSRPSSLVKYQFRLNLYKKTVEVIGGKEKWNFQLKKGRFVRNGGNNHTPEGVNSMLEQMSQWIKNP